MDLTAYLIAGCYTSFRRVHNVGHACFCRLYNDCCGGVFVEYLLLLTIVGIGTIAGLATVRAALIAELIDLADAIAAIN